MSAMMSSFEQSLRHLQFNNFQINLMRSFWIAVFLHVENNILFWPRICRIFEHFEAGLESILQTDSSQFGGGWGEVCVWNVLIHDFRYEIFIENRELCNKTI